MPSLARRRRYQQTRSTVRHELNLGPLTIRFVAIAVVALMAVVYLTQSTRVATRNYQKLELESQIAEASDDISELQAESARLASLNLTVVSGEQDLSAVKGEVVNLNPTPTPSPTPTATPTPTPTSTTSPTATASQNLSSSVRSTNNESASGVQPSLDITAINAE